VFVPGKSFQLGLIFAGKAGYCPSKAPLRGRLLGLPKIMRLGSKRLDRDKYSSLLRTFVNNGLKKFYNIGLWCQRFKTFFFITNKLECFFQSDIFVDMIFAGKAKRLCLMFIER
jgi:hypothetical protein